MPNISSGSSYPQGYEYGRDLNINNFSGVMGYYLSESVRNFSIQQNGANFHFRRWLSSQSNMNLFPYAIDNTTAGALFTRISNPAFVLDAGEFLDPTAWGEFLFTWIYLKSDATNPNHETLYYKSNATGYGYINKAVGDPNYYFAKPGVDLAVKVGDYLYLSFTSDNTDITLNQSLICNWSTWYGAFFRVTDVSVADQITMVEDNTIFATLYPSSNINHFVKSYPVGDPILVSVNSIIYDFGYCFQRPGSTDYLRPIAMTIDETKLPNSHEANGIISTYDNYGAGSGDTLLGAALSDIVISLNLPICRIANYWIYLEEANPANINVDSTSLGSTDANIAPSLSAHNPITIGRGDANPTSSVISSSTRGLPIFLIYVSADEIITTSTIKAVSADYQLGRV